MFDGEGLFLLVQAGDEKDSKRWRLKYRFGGKEKLLALGTFPTASLKVARERRQTARDLLTKGIDLGEARKAEKSSRSSHSEGTFEAAAREWHKVIHAVKTSEGHAARTLIRLEQDAVPSPHRRRRASRLVWRPSAYLPGTWTPMEMRPGRFSATTAETRAEQAPALCSCGPYLTGT